MAQIEIDNESGFCFGVTTAIRKAEEELANGEELYCLGDIVHNSMECERLKALGLVTINHDELKRLNSVKVLLRAHGEPPETYKTAKNNNIEIIVLRATNFMVALFLCLKVYMKRYKKFLKILWRWRT